MTFPKGNTEIIEATRGFRSPDAKAGLGRRKLPMLASALLHDITDFPSTFWKTVIFPDRQASAQEGLNCT